MYHEMIADEISKILDRAGVLPEASMYVYDRLYDVLMLDTEQSLASLYLLLRPETRDLIAIRDGKVTSPRDPEAVIYKKVTGV